MALEYRFETPDRFVVGTIGDEEPRTYCLQVREGNRLLTLRCDPQQVDALASHLARVLDEVSKLGAGIIDVPPAAGAPADTAPLDLPLDQDFTVGTMAIGWDGMANAVHLELFSEAGGAPSVPEEGMTGEEMAAREADRAAEMVSITLQPAAGREFVARARSVLRGSGPACPLCLQPLEPEGHVCPRRNGYKGPGSWPVQGSR